LRQSNGPDGIFALMKPRVVFAKQTSIAFSAPSFVCSDHLTLLVFSKKYF